MKAIVGFLALLQAFLGAAIIDKLYRETVRVLAIPDVRRRLEELGLDVIGSSPAEFAALIKTEIPQWAKVIKDAGIKASE